MVAPKQESVWIKGGAPVGSDRSGFCSRERLIAWCDAEALPSGDKGRVGVNGQRSVGCPGLQGEGAETIERVDVGVAVGVDVKSRVEE